MTLLQEIDTQSRIKPLRKYLDGVKEFGIDVNNDIVTHNIGKIIESVCCADETTPLEEMRGRSEFSAANDMAKGRGVDMNKVNRQRNQKADRFIKNPRLGMQSNTPQKGEWVMGFDGGMGQIVGVKGDQVYVKNQKTGYTNPTDIRSLKVNPVRDEGTGEVTTTWIEKI